MVSYVEPAFPSIRETYHEVYVRAPSDGLPATLDSGFALSFALLQILKSSDDLTEALRLWYILAREVCEKCGYQELKKSKSNKGLTKNICHLQVDNGLLVFDLNSEEFSEASAKIRIQFAVEEGILLQDKQHKCLEVKPGKVQMDQSASREKPTSRRFRQSL
jgi:hypothetical protein